MPDQGPDLSGCPTRQLQALAFVMHVTGVQDDDECQQLILPDSGIMLFSNMRHISAIAPNGDLLDVDALEAGQAIVRTRYEDYAPRMGQGAVTINVDENGETEVVHITPPPGSNN